MEDVKVALSRELTFFDITMIGIAGMIGAGIFALTGIASGIAGPAILLVFLFNGMIATFTGLSYAELGSAIPEAGGSYIWVREAMGDLMGFIAGWCDWAAHTIACSLYAITFGAFFSEIIVKFVDLPQKNVAVVSALAVVTFLTYVNYLGAKESGRLGGAVTLFKVIVLVIFGAFGVYKTLTTPNWVSAFQPFMPHGWVGVLTAMGLTYIAFEGYEIIVQSGEEVKNPERNIPKAIMASLWITVAIYILVAFALIGAVKANIPSWMYLGQLKEYGLIRVANQIMPFGSALIIAGGLVSTVSAMNATIYSSSRVSFAMGRIGYLPKVFSRIHAKHRTPHIATVFSYLIIAVMCLLPIEAVASAADIMFILLFVLVNAVVIILRLRRPDLKRSFRTLSPYLPLTAIVAQITIGYFLVANIEHGDIALEVSILWIFLGLFVYFAYAEKERMRREEEITKTVYEEYPIERKAYRILVSVAHPTYGKRLAKFAEVIAKEKDGEVIVLNVVNVPRQTILSAYPYVEKAKEFVYDVMNVLSVPKGGVVKVGHDVARAILNAVDMLKPDMLIVGWRGRTFRRDVVLGSTIDPILLKAKTDVVVVRLGEIEDIRQILVPTAGGPHSTLALELAKTFAKAFNAKVRVIYVGRSEEDKDRAERAFKVAEDVLKDTEHECIFEIDNDVIGRIAKHVEDSDITFIGATTRSFLKNFIFGVFPERIVKRTTRTVAMTRKWVGVIEAIKPK